MQDLMLIDSLLTQEERDIRDAVQTWVLQKAKPLILSLIHI